MTQALPKTGGSYVRDPKTGKLQPAALPKPATTGKE